MPNNPSVPRPRQLRPLPRKRSLRASIPRHPKNPILPALTSSPLRPSACSHLGAKPIATHPMVAITTTGGKVSRCRGALQVVCFKADPRPYANVTVGE